MSLLWAINSKYFIVMWFLNHAVSFDKQQILIENKYNVAEGYSGNFYDIKSSFKGGIIYPALDPSIFEVKFPDADIKGKVVGDNLGIVE